MKSLFVVLLLCTPIMAQASDPASPAQPVEKEKNVCRSEEVTGSLFPKRVCHSKAEWAALDTERQRSTQQMQNQSRGNGVDVPR